jgi:chaperonin GroES
MFAAGMLLAIDGSECQPKPGPGTKPTNPTRANLQEDTDMTVKLNPLADRVVVKPLEEKEQKKGGIIIPDTAKEKPQEGKVVAVGPGKVAENGERITPEVKKGDRVLYGKYSGTEVTVDGQELLILRESDILATV